MRPGFRSISTSACSQELMALGMISAAGLLAFSREGRQLQPDREGRVETRHDRIRMLGFTRCW
jgi:hypothetical protein